MGIADQIIEFIMIGGRRKVLKIFVFNVKPLPPISEHHPAQIRFQTTNLLSNWCRTTGTSAPGDPVRIGSLHRSTAHRSRIITGKKKD
jgi:hypothetical protein